MEYHIIVRDKPMAIWATCTLGRQVFYVINETIKRRQIVTFNRMYTVFNHLPFPGNRESTKL